MGGIRGLSGFCGGGNGRGGFVAQTGAGLIPNDDHSNNRYMIHYQR